MDRYSGSNGAFYVSPLPGNSQVAVTHGTFVPKRLRRKGKGHELKMQQLIALEKDQYNYTLCTVRADNEAQRRVLKKAGYRLLDSFTSHQTDALTELWGREVGV